MEDESMLIVLIQQYAAKFGMTFSSRAMDDQETKERAMRMMAEAIAGKRGPFTDADLGL